MPDEPSLHGQRPHERQQPEPEQKRRPEAMDIGTPPPPKPEDKPQ